MPETGQSRSYVNVIVNDKAWTFHVGDSAKKMCLERGQLKRRGFSHCGTERKQGETIDAPLLRPRIDFALRVGLAHNDGGRSNPNPNQFPSPNSPAFALLVYRGRARPP